VVKRSPHDYKVKGSVPATTVDTELEKMEKNRGIGDCVNTKLIIAILRQEVPYHDSGALFLAHFLMVR